MSIVSDYRVVGMCLGPDRASEPPGARGPGVDVHYFARGSGCEVL